VASSTIPRIVSLALAPPDVSMYVFTAFCEGILLSLLAAIAVSVSMTEVSILSVLRLEKLVFITVLEELIASDPLIVVITAHILFV
jgi:hypothetical protein